MPFLSRFPNRSSKLTRIGKIEFFPSAFVGVISYMGAPGSLIDETIRNRYSFELYYIMSASCHHGSTRR